MIFRSKSRRRAACRSRHRRAIPQQRSAYSLLEVVMAVGLMAGMLVPSLELIRNGIQVSVETDQRQLLANFASSQVEQRLAMTAASWTTGSFSGDFSSDGLPEIRYITICTDAAVDGGIVDTLMIISSTTYYDANGNDALSAGELSCTYTTKLGNFATYEALVP